MSFKVTKGRKSRYKGQNRSDFDLNKNRQIIHENEALYVIFSKKIISRSNKVTWGQKFEKKVKNCQIWFFNKSRQIIRQIEALNVSNNKKVVSRSFMVKKVYNSRIRSKKVKFMPTIDRFFYENPICVPRAKREAWGILVKLSTRA